jgi:hypothetical protein
MQYSIASNNETHMEGIVYLLTEASEDLPCRNVKAVIPVVIPADVHQPDEAAVPAASNRKCACKKHVAELFAVLLAGDIPLAIPVRRRLDEP